MLRKDFIDLAENGTLGDWCFDDNFTTLWLRYPDPNEDWKRNLPLDQLVVLEEYPIRGQLVSLYITSVQYPAENKSPLWTWDGNQENPTITPSINVIGRWHGYLTNGKLITC